MDPEIKRLVEEVESQLTIAGVDLQKWKILRQEMQKRLVQSNFPKVGDKIYAKYFQHQYFPSRVDSLDREKQEFHITWDDNDPDGRVVKVTDVALDKVPGVAEIGVGSNVLFQQGSYGASGDRSGGTRWHMGRITNISKSPEGKFLYDGEHVFGKSDGKWVTYRGFEQTFSALTIEQLRVSPNVLESFEGSVSETTNSNASRFFDLDVFVCYSNKNTSGKEINPMRIISDVEESLGIKTNLKFRNPSLEEVAIMIQKSKVVLAFISNEFAADESCQQQFQFAKKTKAVPVIPIVVGNGFDWTRTVIGLLIAGELYIHFKDETVYAQKIQELERSMKRSLSDPQAIEQQSSGTQQPKKDACPIFVSYCWTNSNLSFEANEVRNVAGGVYSDPRKVKKDVERKLGGQKLWLDIEQLGTSNQSDRNSSMFEQIAEGLAGAQVILTFISSEYSKSENCNMEFNHAVKTMKIPTVPIIVGEKGSVDWVQRQVGMVLGQIEAKDSRSERIEMRDVDNEYHYESLVTEICNRISRYNVAGEVFERREQIETKSRAPKIGDHVISHWKGGQFFFSTIVSYDKDTMCFIVDWDDGDTTGRVVKYNETAKDELLEEGEGDVAVGTTVLFPQGQYKLNTDDEGYSGFRYFEGEVTSMREEDGKTLYSGHHTRYERGETPRFRGVSYEFNDYPLERLRLAPNAFEVLNIE